MSYQPQDFTAPSGPVRRESALQRQMAEFDAKKAAEAKSVKYADDTRDRSPSSKSKRNGTPHPKGTSPHAPPSPDRDGKYIDRRDTHTPPHDAEYHKNISVTGGNGRDKEEKWAGSDLPRLGIHGHVEEDSEYTKNLHASVDKGGNVRVEWAGEGAPPITHHHKWTSDNEEDYSDDGVKGAAKERSKKSSKTKKYKNAAGDYVEEAEGSDNEISTHHVWRPDSEAQAAYGDEHSKKKKSSSSKKSKEHSRKSSREEGKGSGINTYLDAEGNEVQEAADPDNLKIGHNHQWTD